WIAAAWLSHGHVAAVRLRHGRPSAAVHVRHDRPSAPVHLLHGCNGADVHLPHVRLSAAACFHGSTVLTPLPLFTLTMAPNSSSHHQSIPLSYHSHRWQGPP
uniref:Uncharacterized protein n=1 Tax=Triticum urartu TaxID=4572 RepID=A0A8R7RDR4_TRIUA